MYIKFCLEETIKHVNICLAYAYNEYQQHRRLDKLILTDITIEVSSESSMEVIKKLTLIKN